MVQLSDYADEVDNLVPDLKNNQPTGSTPMPELIRIAEIPVAPLIAYQYPKSRMTPAYLSNGVRQYSNPISYLGGPRIEPKSNRSSLESILSLD